MAKRVALNKRDREKMGKRLLERRAELLTDLHGNEAEIDFMQDPKADDLDRAVEAGAMELLVALGDTERRELEEITLALEKLANNSYGKCEACLQAGTPDPLIPQPRLDAVPTARLCVECQEAEEQNQLPNYTRLRPRRMIFGEDEEFTHPLMDSNDDS